MLHKSQGYWPSASGEEDFLKVLYHIWVWRPSWSCDQDHLHKLLLPHPKESPYEIWVQLAPWFLRKHIFLHFNLLMVLQYEWPWLKVKGQPWPLELIYSHCLIMLNLLSENNDFGFNSFQKINFSKNFPFKCIRLTFSRSRSTLDHHLNKLGRSLIPYATYQVPRLSALWFWRF